MLKDLEVYWSKTQRLKSLVTKNIILHFIECIKTGGEKKKKTVDYH